jgi:hypothetical protein
MITPSQNFKGDYDKYVAKATMLIHSQETTEAVLNMLSGQDPVQRVANATVMIMQRLDMASRQAGVEVQDTVKMFGAHEIVKMISELGEAANKLKLDDRHQELALSVAVQDYVKGEIAAHRIDPKRLQVQMEADMRKLPPKARQEIQQSQLRIQQTARQYNSGKGLAQPGINGE